MNSDLEKRAREIAQRILNNINNCQILDMSHRCRIDHTQQELIAFSQSEAEAQRKKLLQQLWNLFEDHYWDSLDSVIVLKHLQTIREKFMGILNPATEKAE